MSDAEHNNQPTTKPCRICGEDIKLAARKCVHCDSWQDWRRFFAVTPLVASLVATCISVAAIAIPIIVSAIRPPNSEFQVSFQADSPEELSILVANTGTRPGSLLRAVLIVNADRIAGDWDPSLVPADANIPAFYLDPIAPSKRAALYISPGTTPISLSSSQQGTRQIVLHTDFFEIDEKGRVKPPVRCRLAVFFANFDGARSYRTIDSPCFHYASFLDAHAAATDTPGIRVGHKIAAGRYVD